MMTPEQRAVARAVHKRVEDTPRGTVYCEYCAISLWPCPSISLADLSDAADQALSMLQELEWGDACSDWRCYPGRSVLVWHGHCPDCGVVRQILREDHTAVQGGQHEQDCRMFAAITALEVG